MENIDTWNKLMDKEDIIRRRPTIESLMKMVQSLCVGWIRMWGFHLATTIPQEVTDMVNEESSSYLVGVNDAADCAKATHS